VAKSEEIKKIAEIHGILAEVEIDDDIRNRN
jgi:hypothetical protein